MRDQMLVRPGSNSLRDRVAQPGPHVAEATRAERVSSAAPPVSSTSNMELAKIARIIRDRVVRNRPLPLIQGCSEGERSGLNDPVFFTISSDGALLTLMLGRIACRQMYPPTAGSGPNWSILGTAV